MICELILQWQSSANPRDLELLLDAAGGLLDRTARAALCHQRVTDPAAVDDTVSLVLNHLRRLPGGSPRERPVACFAPRSSPTGGDPGEAYLVWLTTERARDVARFRRQRDQLVRPFSSVDVSGTAMHRHAAAVCTTDSDEAADSESERMREAVEQLEPRLAAVVRMLLDGLSQAAIAARLQVCEGTVSRLRGRAIAQLRHLVLRK